MGRGRPKKYQTEEEMKAAKAEYMRKWREANKAEIAEYMRKYRETNKAEILESQRKYQKRYRETNPEYFRKWREVNSEYGKKWRETPYGRASNLLANYREMDRRNGFGDCIDFDAQWILDSIFTQKCKYCNCTDWHKLGCNRIDNSKPHIKDNIEPCCLDCNRRLPRKTCSISA